MNNIKKILSMVLCLAMLLSMNASAFATGGTEEPATEDCGHNNFSVVSTEATCDTAGLKTFACQTEGCDYSYTETVEATGHSYVDGVCACGDVAVCNKEETCPANNHEADCLKKLADDAAAAKAAADQAKIDEVNGLIAALPSYVTTGNYDTVMAQLEIIKAYETEMGELWNQLDLVKLNAVINATYAPMTLDDCTCTASCTDSRNTDCSFCVDTNNVCPKGAAVAKIGDVGYESLELAFSSAGESDTITLLSDATPVLTSQRAITKAAAIDLGGKTLTLTEDDLYFGTTVFRNGNIVVDPSVKPSTAVFWMFANQTLTFDAVTITATGVTGTYLIGLDGNNADLNLLNGSQIIVNNSTALDLDIICVNASTGNDILISNSKVTVNNLDGRVFFRGNYTVNGNSDIDLSGITKAGFRIEAGQTLTIADTATVDIVGEPRDGGIHLTDLSAVYTKADTATVNATLEEPVCYAKIGDKKFGSLQEAVDAAVDGDEIVFQSDITENVTVTQKENVKFTINGNDQTMKGSITVDGKSARYATAGVTIKNINFVYENIQGDAFVNLGVSGDTNTRYTNNVTVDSCTFSGSGDKPVGVKSYTGGDLNLTITNCTANAGTHSLVQVDNVEENLVITNNKVYSKNGMNLNATQGDILISNNIVSVKGYAVRTGATSGTATTPNIVLSGNTLTTDNSEGDAVVVVRSTTTGASITMSKNVVSGNVHISGNTADTDITADANYWDGQKAPVVPEGGIKVSVASYYEDEDLTKLAKGDGAVAENNGQYYSDLQAAVDAAENGDTVVLLLPQPMYDSLIISKNITLDLNKLTLSASAGLVNKPVVRVLGNVTITNGTVDGTPGQNSYAVNVGQGETAGTLNIANGTYKGITSAISITNGTANISGGSFSTGHDGEGTDYGAQYLLNCIDDNYKNGKAVFNVTGGTFAGFNPQNNAAEGAGTKFTPLGYKGTEDANGNFIVEVDPEAFEAKIGGTNYLTIQAAVDAAAAGDEIVVLKEHAPTTPIVVEKNLTIDFANKKMECSDIYPVVRVQGGATLTVKNGNITNDNYVFVLGASDSSSAGNLNIESGTYHGATTVVSVTKGELNISGGSFSADPYNGGYDFLLNCYDPNRADCKITVKGGSFANFDPANNAAEGAGTNFVADNYVSVADGSNYTVKPLVTVTFNNAEMVRGNAQPSYTYSSNADVHGYTVEVTPAAITLNDNTSEYDINASTVVVKNGSTDVTANCKVEVTPGKLTVKTAAVKLTSGSTDTYYETLADAAAAAKDGDTITLQADNANDVSLSDNVTLALNGKSYTGTATVAEGKQLSMSLADLKTLTDGLKVKGEVKIGDTEIAMTDGTVKADASGNITATPTPAEDGFVGVWVNGVAILTKDGSVKVDSNGVASVSGYAHVILADGSEAVLEKGGSVDKTGAITTTPAEVTNEDGEGVGYGAVTVISKDGKTQTGYLVPAGESLTLKLNSKNVLEPSTAKDVEDPIVDAGADFKNYLSVDPAKRSFYNKSYVSLTFTCNGFIDGLEKLEVRSSANNYAKVLTANECSVTQGSTVVKLKNSYLRTLALGAYTLTYTYADGQTAEATFYVVNTPLTGDFSNLAPFAAVMGFSIVALACVLVLLKKRKA